MPEIGCPVCGKKTVFRDETQGAISCAHCGQLLAVIGDLLPDDRVQFDPLELEPSDRPWDFQQTLLDLTPRVFVTPTIVAINVLVFIAMVVSGVNLLQPTLESLILWGADFGPMTLGGEWWRLLTSTFIHIGIIHIAMNMWVLWDAGFLVERVFGNVGFLLLYVISGLMGSLVSIWWHPSIVSAGASGAVFGVYGALLGLLAWNHKAIPREVLYNLRNSTLGFVGVNIFFGMAVPGIDQAAHLGGLAAGFLCGLLLGQPLIPAAAHGRLVRNALLAVAGVLAIGGAVIFVLRAHSLQAEFHHFEVVEKAEFHHFEVVEKQVLEKYNSAVKKSHRGDKLSEDELATIVERDVLPEWRKVRERLESVHNLPKDNQQKLANLIEYVSVRQEAWELLVQGIRDEDFRKRDLSNVKQKAADALAWKLGSK